MVAEEDPLIGRLEIVAVAKRSAGVARASFSVITRAAINLP